MTMLAMSGMQLLMAVALFLVCVLLMLIILVQKGRGGGLASAFGGGGGSGSAFGSKTGDVFTGITVVLACVYLMLTVVGNYVLQPETGAPMLPGVSTRTQPASQTPPAGPAPAQAPTAGQTTPAAPDAAPAAADTGEPSVPQGDTSDDAEGGS